MRKAQFTIFLVVLLGMSTLSAQNVYDIKSSYYGNKPAKEEQTSDNKEDEKKTSNGIFTGFSGGCMVHIGYAFSNSPDELFRNGSLENVSGLPKDGVTLGIGGALRVHLINHIHVGMEGAVSNMPLMKNSSFVRNGWGGALCDYFGTVGKVQLFIGGTIGGGVSKRVYTANEEIHTIQDETVCNASYTQTRFFLLDPYVGMEFSIHKGVSLLLKVDYMLPFGDKNSGIKALNWSNFISPSGPRLYVGFMFGHSKK